VKPFLAAHVFVFFCVIVAIFQLALAAGMPWGKLVMGGKFPGRYPPAMRFVCLIQIFILTILGTIVFTRAGIIFPKWFPASKKIIWGVVAFSVLGVMANLATPSKWERMIWAPVAIVLMACSLLVAVA
jgi:hypothetical protein